MIYDNWLKFLPILLLSLTTMIYCTRPFGQSVKLQKIKLSFILKDLSLFLYFDIRYLFQTVCPFIFFCFSINGCCQPCCKISVPRQYGLHLEQVHLQSGSGVHPSNRNKLSHCFGCSLKLPSRAQKPSFPKF